MILLTMLPELISPITKIKDESAVTWHIPGYKIVIHFSWRLTLLIVRQED